MFFAIIFIAIGAALLFNAIIPIAGSFWGIFWGIIFLAIGVKMISSRGCCPMCTSGWWSEKMGGQMEEEECECGHDHQENPRKQK